MQYYKLINKEIELTEEGHNALSTLGITLDELVDYPDEKLEASYWQGCKTYVAQALKNQKGITWLDDGRIPTDSKLVRPPIQRTQDEAIFPLGKGTQTEPLGRFPSNLLVSDDVLNDGKVSKGQTAKHKSHYEANQPVNIGGGEINTNYPDSGSFSRYFDLDKWAQKTFPFLIVPKASKSEKNEHIDSTTTELGHNRFDVCANCGGYILQNPDRPSACKCETPERQPNKVKGNYHPTVKPLKLMSYLITLGSRQGDVVLDPYSGSGTTPLASMLLNRKCVSIELKEAYCQIAIQRFSQTVMNLKTVV